MGKRLLAAAVLLMAWATVAAIGCSPNPEAPPRPPLEATAAASTAFFFGLGPDKGGAAHVVYVSDRTGSMLATFDAIREEMIGSIARLDANHGQDFHVILWADGPPLEMEARKLTPATRANQFEAIKFLLEVHAKGATDPLPAIERAFDVLDKAGPGGKVMYLLTDSVFTDNQKVLELCRKRNARKDVRIFTILYSDDPEEPVEKGAEEIMKKIASENDGKYKFVRGEE